MVNKSFKFHIFTIINSKRKFYKIEKNNMKSCLIHSVYHW